MILMEGAVKQVFQQDEEKKTLAKPARLNHGIRLTTIRDKIQAVPVQWKPFARLA